MNYRSHINRIFWWAFLLVTITILVSCDVIETSNDIAVKRKACNDDCTSGICD